MVTMTMTMTCPSCIGTGCKTDDNGVIYDDPCSTCVGEGVVAADEYELACLDAIQVRKDHQAEVGDRLDDVIF